MKAISGVHTVRFKNELERNITIKLGYANAKIYQCVDPECPRPVRVTLPPRYRTHAGFEPAEGVVLGQLPLARLLDGGRCDRRQVDVRAGAPHATGTTGGLILNALFRLGSSSQPHRPPRGTSSLRRSAAPCRSSSYPRSHGSRAPPLRPSRRGSPARCSAMRTAPHHRLVMLPRVAARCGTSPLSTAPATTSSWQPCSTAAEG